MRRTVTVIMTVKNDAAGCAVTLESLTHQTRAADEIIVVDGGSTDETPGVIRAASTRLPHLRWIDAPGTNIAQGRNIATKAANGDVIASTDGGCRAQADWLEKLVAPFDTDPRIEFVAGFYQIEARSLLERVVGLATMRGQLEPVDPATFNPSGRSMAYTKQLWMRAGGWPEWLRFSEDTLFDHKLRRMNARWRFVPEAIVHWRPRTTLRKIAKQFYHYGTGRGHTQIGAADFAYNVRNAAVLIFAIGLCFVTPVGLALAPILFTYFYVLTFHAKAVQVAARTGDRRAYILTMLVMWVVLASNTLGYLIGSWQRIRHRNRYRQSMTSYLEAA